MSRRKVLPGRAAPSDDTMARNKETNFILFFKFFILIEKLNIFLHNNIPWRRGGLWVKQKCAR